MRTALDSNILSCLWSDEPGAPTVSLALREAKREGSLILSPIAFAELFAYPRATKEFVLSFLAEKSIRVDSHLQDSLWTEAGLRFAQYAKRRRESGGGQVRGLIADFVVGTHALLQADRLMTTDLGRYERDFPELSLIHPGGSPTLDMQ